MTGKNPDSLGGDISPPPPFCPACLGLLRVGEVDGGCGDPEGWLGLDPGVDAPLVPPPLVGGVLEAVVAAAWN